MIRIEVAVTGVDSAQGDRIVRAMRDGLLDHCKATEWKLIVSKTGAHGEDRGGHVYMNEGKKK